MQDILPYIGYGTVLTLVEIILAAISVALEPAEKLSMFSSVKTFVRFYILNIIFIVILSKINIS